jgi:hypothetical protein
MIRTIVPAFCKVPKDKIDRAMKWIFGEYKEGANTERAQIVGSDGSSGALWRDLPFLLAFALVVVGGAGLVFCFIK